jgi:hypothetical protein
MIPPETKGKDPILSALENLADNIDTTILIMLKNIDGYAIENKFIEHKHINKLNDTRNIVLRWIKEIK